MSPRSSQQLTRDQREISYGIRSIFGECEGDCSMTTELCPAELDAAYFMAEHGHLPMLDEGPDPWLYQG
jgi:hypothetical protein